MKIPKLLGVGVSVLLTLGAGLAGAADKPSLKIGYVDGWADSVATTHVAAEVIKQKLGYPVELLPVATGIMWQGVAKGQLDAMLSAWLPVTHGAYNEKLKGQVVNLGANFNDAKIGLIVPEYVKAKSIADLAGDKAAFGGRIIGIDAGSGVMLKTDEAIKAYGLDYKLLASSGSAMTAQLGRDIKSNKSVAVTGWIPHWMFAKWKLRFLEDPKNIYGAAEHVDSIANPGLEAKAPPVYAFLKKFNWSSTEIGEVMLAIEEGAKPAAAAEKWVNDNPERVQEWLK